MSCAMYSVTSCSGLIQTSTDNASSANSFGCFVYSEERMRAIFVRVR